MSEITPAEVQLLETFPQRTKLWLSIYNPSTVLACQVNDASIAREEMEITFDGVTEGSHLLVESGMVLYVGSSAGADDKGHIRVKSATASVLTVAENSHINWADDDHLTVVNFYEITPIFQRIIQDPADPEDVIFYKDYDVAYTNQNSVLGSFVCMGPHHAGFLENGEHSVFYSSSGTFNVNGDALTYEWWFQGADTTGSASQQPGEIAYSTPGHYTTRLTVSNDSGGEDISYRHVSIYDRPENGTNNPILSWQLVSLEGDRDSGGYSGRIRVHSDVLDDVVRDESLVVLFSDDWYGSTKQSIGGNAYDRSSIVFVGYVVANTIIYNWQENFVEFDIGSPTRIMKMKEGFSVSVESKVTPYKWFEVQNMNVRKALYHYLRWHSTALLCNDFEFVGDDQNIQYFDSDRTSIYDAVNTLMSSSLVGNFVADRQGKGWAEISVSALPSGTVPPETNLLDITKDRWIGSPIINERFYNEVSWIEMGGIQFDGPATGDFLALLSQAPGSAPSYSGRVERFQGLALSSQAQLNELVGNVYTFKNSRYPSIVFQLAGNYRNYDIAPQERVPVNIAATDTPRGIVFNDKPFLIGGMSFAYNSEQQILLPTINTQEITSGVAGITQIVGSLIPIPDSPPIAGGSPVGGGFSIPPLQVPPIPKGIDGGLSFIIKASAKHRSESEYDPDDPNYPGWDIADGNWKEIPLETVAGGVGWENGITLDDNGRWVIPFTAKYLVSASIYISQSGTVKLDITERDTPIADDATAWTRIAIGDGFLVGQYVSHFDAGDTVKVYLYNGTGDAYITGQIYASIALADTYPGVTE